MNWKLNLYCLSICSLILFACGGDVIPDNPINELKKKLQSKEKYTILLEDMDVKNNQFLHKYKILVFENDTVLIENTKWYKVDEDFFALHEDDLGMEIFSKFRNGKINTLASPPGFTNVIDDTLYGNWNSPEINIDLYDESFDSSFWVFNPNYFYLREGLGLNELPIFKSEYINFANYSFLVKPYYGTSEFGDSTYYGTRSRYLTNMRPGFYSRKRSKNNFSGPGTGYSGGFGSRGGGGFGK